MKKQTDILILTASFGLGHNSVAKAIAEQTIKLRPNLNVTTIDLLDLIFPASKYNFYKKYDFFIKHITPVYNFFYTIKKSNSNSLPDKFIYLTKLNQMSCFLQDINPKLIVSTFPICSGLVSKFKDKNNSNIPLVTCITDVVHSMEWIHPNTDRYFVATNSIKSILITKGIHKDKIKVTGVPVRHNFLEYTPHVQNNEKICKELLIMGGGLGNLKLDNGFFSWLNYKEGIHSTIITGKNESLYNSLINEKNEKNLNNINIVGFTNDVADYMKNSDLLITKAGGISIFEAIYMELPMIIVAPSMGQEIENAKFIKNYSLGIVKNNMTEIKLCLDDYIYSDKRLNDIKQNIRNIKKELKANKVGEYIIELL
ncbi:MAG: glycosyltransferase [Bacillota bacterium]|nr:glycosyltransferase [Bacillota bacterium]